MARDTTIRLDDREKRALDVVSAHEFGRENKPYGDILRVLFNTYKDKHKFGEDI